MILRALLIGTLLTSSPMIAFADGHADKSVSKSEARHAKLSIATKDIKGLRGEKLIAVLAEHLTISTNADAVRVHTLIIRNGEIVGKTASVEAILRKRPGRAKYAISKEALPSNSDLEGFKLETFAVPALNELLLEKGAHKVSTQEMALQAFKAAGQTDGLFIVTTWDDMAPGDTTRGLVGFGSWN